MHLSTSIWIANDKNGYERQVILILIQDDSKACLRKQTS
jgi:hypothetical protein